MPDGDKSGVPEDVSQTARELAAKRWSRLTPEQRAAEMLPINAARQKALSPAKRSEIAAAAGRASAAKKRAAKTATPAVNAPKKKVGRPRKNPPAAE